MFQERLAAELQLGPGGAPAGPRWRQPGQEGVEVLLMEMGLRAAAEEERSAAVEAVAEAAAAAAEEEEEAVAAEVTAEAAAEEAAAEEVARGLVVP